MLIKSRDGLKKIPGHQIPGFILHYTFGIFFKIQKFVLGSLTQLVGNTVDDAQSMGAIGGNPNTNGSTDPTHSQLAKDHDNHPFHVIAAKLAIAAVKPVGADMAARWNGDPTANPAKTAADYLVHPNDSTWQDNIVAQWAKQNPANVKRGESATEWEALEKEHGDEIRETIDNLNKKVKGMQGSTQRSWDYINQYYQELFEEKNQVNIK